MLTKQENMLRRYLKILSALYLIIFIFTFISLFMKAQSPAISGTSLLIGEGSAAFFFFLIFWYALADIRKYGVLIKINIWASALTGIAGICILLWNVNHDIISLGFFSSDFNSFIALIAGCNLIQAFLVSILFSSAEKARFGLKYFSPLQFKTLSALAEVVIYGEKEVLTSEEVARNVDIYFKSFEAKSKWTMALVISALYFYPVLSLMPPLPYISPERRLAFLKKRFYMDVEARLMPEFWRVFAQGMIRIAKQMCYIGYYNDKRTFASVGYVPFSERKDLKERMEKSPVKNSPQLSARTEQRYNRR